MSDDDSELRRRPRQHVPGAVAVVDCMTGHAIGRLGNLSETGMLLITNASLLNDALYQLRFELCDVADNVLPIEIGTQLLWQDAANTTGQFMAGLHFINRSESQHESLRAWLDKPEGSDV